MNPTESRGERPVPDFPAEIHWTKLPEAKPGDVFFREWTTYRQEIGRLLEQGHEGRHVLIKGDRIIGLYDSWESAREAGLNLYLIEPFLVQPIRSWEPVLRVRGLNFPCRA